MRSGTSPVRQHLLPGDEGAVDEGAHAELIVVPEVFC
jgi:hypothetical protein